ncbi:MAG: ABC transporter ATP-binding protein [Acidobacteriota bacterium]
MLSDAPLLCVEDLEIRYPENGQFVEVVRGASLSMERGETVGLVGESGSGKTLTALAVMGLVPPPGEVHVRRLELEGVSLVGMPEKQMRALRGARVAMVFQEPMTAINPVISIGRQLTEVLRTHRSMTRIVAVRAAVRLLGRVAIGEPETRLRSFPHQLSGGQLQRVLLATALASEPVLLMADEPTTALDVTVQAQILDLMSHLQEELDLAVLLITHDLAVVANTCRRVCVMRSGRIVEEGSVREVFSSPGHPYTEGLLQALPRIGSPAPRGKLPTVPSDDSPDAERPRLEASASDRAEVGPELSEELSTEATPQPTGSEGASGVLLRAEKLCKTFFLRRQAFWGPRPQLRAVDGVDLEVRRGEVFGIVGESGSGKTTLARCLLRLLEADSGRVVFDGVDVGAVPAAELRRLRRQFQMVFQDPYASLNPRLRVGRVLAEPMRLHGLCSRREEESRVAHLLDRVGLSPSAAERYPQEFSGGQRQRIGIARALACEPQLLVADEPVSALDVSVQAQIMNLLADLQRDLGLTVIFISHDLAVVEQIADRVAVMYLGQIVEQAETGDLFSQPKHSYTRSLLSAIPRIDTAIGA